MVSSKDTALSSIKVRSNRYQPPSQKVTGKTGDHLAVRRQAQNLKSEAMKHRLLRCHRLLFADDRGRVLAALSASLHLSALAYVSHLLADVPVQITSGANVSLRSFRFIVRATA